MAHYKDGRDARMHVRMASTLKDFVGEVAGVLNVTRSDVVVMILELVKVQPRLVERMSKRVRKGRKA